MGFVGIAFLVYFIHHIATSIQASQILAAVSEETLKAVDHLFPEGVGQEDADDTQCELNRPGETWHAVPALQTGYVQEIDTAELLAFAGERGAVIRMKRVAIIEVFLPIDLRYRRRIRREDSLDNPATSSPHGHEVRRRRQAR